MQEFILNISQIALDKTIQWFLASGFKVVIIVVAAWIVIRILHSFVHRVIKLGVEQTYDIKDSVALEKRINTLHRVIFSSIKVVGWALVALIVLAEFNVNIGPLIAAAGIVGLAFGFGGQYLIRDMISGLFIILEDQYRKGDVIQIGGVKGKVEDITLRKTTLRDGDGVEHHVPNGTIDTTSNFTKLWSRINLKIGISYESDIEKAMRVINRVGEEMTAEKDWKDVITEAPEALGVDELADSAVILKVQGETKPSEQWSAMRELRKRIKIAFEQEGIEIPYPHRTIVKK